MNYQKHYDVLIERARVRSVDGYVERHHVLPRCLGGNNDNENIVKLTPEEHYVAHQLLVKLHPGDRKVLYAAQAMCIREPTKGLPKNKLYGWLRKRLSLSKIGVPRSPETRLKLRIAQTGKKHGQQAIDKLRAARKLQKTSDETREKMRIAQLGKKHSVETRKLIGDIGRGRKLSEEAKAERRAYRHTDETKARMSLSRKGIKFSEERKARMSGRKLSEETRAKQSAYAKARSPEHRARLMASFRAAMMARNYVD